MPGLKSKNEILMETFFMRYKVFMEGWARFLRIVLLVHVRLCSTSGPNNQLQRNWGGLVSLSAVLRGSQAIFRRA